MASSPIDRIEVQLKDASGVETLVSADGQDFDRQLFAARVELAMQDPGLWVYQEALFDNSHTLTSQTPYELDPDFVELIRRYPQGVRSVRIDMGAFRKVEVELPFDEDIFDRIQTYLLGLEVPGYKLAEVYFYQDPLDEDNYAGVVGRSDSPVSIARIRKRFRDLQFVEDDPVQLSFTLIADRVDPLYMYNSGPTFLAGIDDEISPSLECLQSIDPNGEVPERFNVSVKLVDRDEPLILPVIARNLTEFAAFVCGEWDRCSTYE